MHRTKYLGAAALLMFACLVHNERQRRGHVYLHREPFCHLGDGRADVAAATLHHYGLCKWKFRSAEPAREQSHG